MASDISKQDDSTLASQGLPSATTSAGTLQVEKTFAMVGGIGADSYAKNSSFQGTVADKVIIPFYEKVLDNVERVAPSGDSPVVRVADLGCSSGFNAIAQMSHIVQKLTRHYVSNDASRSPPECQAFFCDLPSNDFNTLFQLLTKDKEHGFFMSGNPGSIYGRLYPRSSISIFYSSFCLHWLSKIPDAVLDKNSPAFNKVGFGLGKESSPATRRALQEQAASDLKTFLHARAIELTPGGVLMFAVSGEISDEGEEHPNIFNVVQTRFNQLWRELAEKGIVSQEAADSFFVPLYLRSMEEILEAVQLFSSAFSIHHAEMVDLENFQDNMPTSSAEITGACKAMVGAMMKNIAGDEQSEIFWDRASQVLETEILPNRDKYRAESRILLIALTKKEDVGDLY